MYKPDHSEEIRKELEDTRKGLTKEQRFEAFLEEMRGRDMGEDTRTWWQRLWGRLWHTASRMCGKLTGHRWNELVEVVEIYGPVIKCRICRAKWFEGDVFDD